jgi:aminoglycoside 3-N-acetyltransferase
VTVWERLQTLRRGYGLRRGLMREALLRADFLLHRVGKRELIAGLRGLGLKEGDLVCVHTAFRSLGFVVGGPPTVIRALEEVVGPEGTILMPAYSTGGMTVNWVKGSPVFDVRRTPSDLGVLPEVFRTMPGTLRSLHPTHSVCGRGRLAAALLADHEKAARPFGHGTPFMRLIERGGKGLILGARLHNFTTLRTIEDHLGASYPLNPYLSVTFPVEIVDEAGQRRTVRTLVPDPALGPRRNGDVFLPFLRERGLVREGRVGRANAILVECAPLLDALEAATRQGILAYRR